MRSPRHLTGHEWHEVVRDTIGVWAPMAILLLRALHERRREARARTLTA